MKKMITRLFLVLWLMIMAASYWVFLPDLNPLDTGFWIFVVEGLILAFVGIFIMALADSVGQQTKKPNVGRRDVSQTKGPYDQVLIRLGGAILLIVALLFGLGFFNSRIFRAKSYANVITVKEADLPRTFQRPIFQPWPSWIGRLRRKLGTPIWGPSTRFPSLGFPTITVRLPSENNPIGFLP